MPDFVDISRHTDSKTTPHGPKMCNGGMAHLYVAPNGDAYRCSAHWFLKRNPIGNIYDPNFSPLQRFEYCPDGCSTCDLGYVSIYVADAGRVSQLQEEFHNKYIRRPEKNV